MGNKWRINKLHVPENEPTHHYALLHFTWSCRVRTNNISDVKSICLESNSWLSFKRVIDLWQISLQTLKSRAVSICNSNNVRKCHAVFSSRTLKTFSNYQVIFDEHFELSLLPTHMSQFNRTWLKNFVYFFAVVSSNEVVAIFPVQKLFPINRV